MDVTRKRYLQLLSRSFPTLELASAEVINLSAIMNLPKGTEFFASDIHGEAEAFSHILRNGSGSIRLKVDEVFGDELSEAEKRSLCTLIYYPREKAKLMLAECADEAAFYATYVPRLVAVVRRAARKYTRSRVRKQLPQEFAYLLEELIASDVDAADKEAYYDGIVDAAVRTGRGIDLIEALAQAIQRLAISRLHIIGDIYDRGPAPDTVMETLIAHHNVDIQWGNHDIVWMGASLGQRGCIANVVRICSRYGNLSILEDAYGINILPLATFAQQAYRDDPCVGFGLKGNPALTPAELELNVKIQKAMAIIQFKVEAALIKKYPGFKLDDRNLLGKIDRKRGTVVVDGVEYELTDKVFPTVDPDDPYALTPEEEEVMARLEAAFLGSEKLQRHMRFFLEAGSLYKVSNGNLLLHACVPLNDDGSLKEVEIFGQTYKGRSLYDVCDRYVRAAFFSHDAAERERGRDLLWYLWLGQGSPLFAKSKMATFELYLIAEKPARKEVKNAFYNLIDDERVIAGIFEDFGLDPESSHIICGHVPVKVKDGEDPVKCAGRVIMIDGGFSRAYQPTTGIAGYTLISNSHEFILAAHEPLESAEAAVRDELDIHSSRRVVERGRERTLVACTDTGAELAARIEELEELIEAYKTGEIQERAEG